MKNNRWKSAVIIGTMAVLAVSGGILAYFTDTEEKVNNFTVGSIEIELQEPAWESKPDTDQDGVRMRRKTFFHFRQSRKIPG